MKRFLFVTLIVMFVSCHVDKPLGNEFVDIDITENACFTEQAFGTPVLLTSEIFNDSIIHNSRSLTLLDSCLFTIDISTSTDTLVRYYSLPDRKYKGFVYLKGQGPLEVLSPSSVHPSCDKSSFWIYDTAKRNFMGRLLSSLSEDREDVCEQGCESISLNKSAYYGVEDVFWMDEKRILLSDFYHYKERFFIMDTCTYKMQAVVNPYLHVKDVYSPKILADILSTRKSITPNHSRVVLAGRYLDILEIYDEKGNLVKMLKGPEKNADFDFEKERSIANKILIKSRKTRRAYLAVKTTNDKIYALYSGKCKEDKEHYSYSKKLYVFSLDGKPLKKYLLDVPIIDFEIDEANRILYAVSDNAEIRCFVI